MRFNQFEREALINFGKKHGYITEGMSDEQIDEILPALAGVGRMAAKGAGALAKGAGKLAVKGAKAAAPHIKRGAVATAKGIGRGVKAGAKAAGGAVAGALANKAQGMGATGSDVQQLRKDTAAQGGIAGKIANTNLAKNMTNKVAGKMAPGQEVPPGADQTPSPTGQPDQKATQKVAQRATAMKGIAGGKASGGMVAKGMDKVAQGGTLPPNLIKAIQPYTTSIQTIMQDPQLFSKFKLLMKQAKAGQAQAQQ